MGNHREKIIEIIHQNNPDAKLCYIHENGIVYVAEHENLAIMFVIPIKDVTGVRKFDPVMKSIKLIKWFNIVNIIVDN